jgi:hypothetical protein
MSKFKEVAEEQWNNFLKWYDCYTEKGYEWYPVTMADRVDIFDLNDNKHEMIAYKNVGYGNDEFLINNSYFQMWQIGLKNGDTSEKYDKEHTIHISVDTFFNLIKNEKQ